MILFSAKKSAVHDMHLSAVSEYAKSCDLRIGLNVSGFSALLPLLKSPDRSVFSQATGFPSLLFLPLSRLLGKKVVHYMHEPTSLRLKLKENPWVKALVWHAVQWVEMRAATRVLVSRQTLLDQAAEVYGIAKEKITVAPLLMPTVCIEVGSTPYRVTYLGRIDERRYFEEFLKIAPRLARHGFCPTVLTGDTEGFDKYRNIIPSEVETFVERNFSEAVKRSILSETLCLWNPKRGEISQSGVTADAVRYGVAIILTNKDPSFSSLISAEIAIKFENFLVEPFEALQRISPDGVRRRAAERFSEFHGEAAFRQYYLSELL